MLLFAITTFKFTIMNGLFQQQINFESLYRSFVQ